jgi:predicted ATP-dependent endonuclease of OLD family
MAEPNKNHNIKLFRIESLFGYRNVSIPFETSFKVLIGENGIGKTTILNAIYYTLTCNFSKLNTLIFSKIIVEFDSGKVVEINKPDLEVSEQEMRLKGPRDVRIIEIFNQFFSEEEKLYISKTLQSGGKTDSRLSELFQKLQKHSPYPVVLLKSAIATFFAGKAVVVNAAKQIIANEVRAEILYFPTYRRIEEELHKLGGAVEDLELATDDRTLIHFGMEDVSLTFDSVIERIKNSSIQGFSEITGEMLIQYLGGPPQLDGNIRNIIKPEILKIILERVGENISVQNKEKIIELVKSEQVFSGEHYKYLLNFLSKLIKIYDQQKDIDNAIKNFEATCNGYLIGKRVVYNESKVTIKIVQDYNQLDIQLKNLSSGEKQIISLFAKIIFNDSSNIIVLFDEPELSLSLEWQRKILPDILRAKKCRLILAVTHSPFIFDNELDQYAEDISHFVTNNPSPETPESIKTK